MEYDSVTRLGTQPKNNAACPTKLWRPSSMTPQLPARTSMHACMQTSSHCECT